METKQYEHLFDPEDKSGKILMDWWRALEDDRGGRAELRRAKKPAEVVFCPAYHQLYNALRLSNREALACVAGVIAYVKTQRPDKSLAFLMAEGDKPCLSGLRFRRFLAIDNRQELYLSAIRIVRILKNGTNVCNLAQVLYWWNEITKKQLAYEYYANANAE